MPIIKMKDNLLNIFKMLLIFKVALWDDNSGVPLQKLMVK